MLNVVATGEIPILEETKLIYFREQINTEGKSKERDPENRNTKGKKEHRKARKRDRWNKGTQISETYQFLGLLLLSFFEIETF